MYSQVRIDIEALSHNVESQEKGDAIEDRTCQRTLCVGSTTQSRLALSSSISVATLHFARYDSPVDIL